MSDSVVTLVGALAALGSTVSFTPQAWKVIKTRDTKDLSAATYAITVSAFVLWFAYGILLGDIPLIATNGICLLLSGFILSMILFPQDTKDKIADALDPAKSESS